MAREPGIEAQVRGLGKRLLPTRKETDLSRSTLAVRAGLDLAAVSFLERAMRAPTLGALVRLACAVDATPSLLVAGGTARPIRQPAVAGLAGGLRYACREAPRPTPRAADLLLAAAPAGRGRRGGAHARCPGDLERFGASPREAGTRRQMSQQELAYTARIARRPECSSAPAVTRGCAGSSGCLARSG